MSSNHVSSPPSWWVWTQNTALSSACYGVSFAPVYWLFAIKTIQQTSPEKVSFSEAFKKITLRDSLLGSLKTAPTVGVTIGVQSAAIKIIEHLFKRMDPSRKEPTMAQMVASAAIVGFVSTPFLAVLNGYTMTPPQTWKQSIKALSWRQPGAWRQTAAITVRESSFLLAIRISGPAAEAMRAYLGENRPVEYGVAFMTGVVGSLTGHAADSALSLWQKKRTIIRLQQLSYGSPARAVAVGGFSVFYKALNDALK